MQKSHESLTNTLTNELVSAVTKFAKERDVSPLSEETKEQILLGFISAFNIIILSIIDDHEERKTKAKDMMQAVLVNLDKFKDFRNEKSK